jgi:hypothetical protein
MSQKPLEKSITDSILKWLNDQPDTRAIKSHGGPYRSGEPDIIGCALGRFFALEVKRPGGKVTPLQTATLARWSEAGGQVAVVHSLDEAKSVYIAGVDKDRPRAEIEIREVEA